MTQWTPSKAWRHSLNAREISSGRGAFGILDDFHHRLGVGGLFEGGTEIFIVQKLGDVGEGMKMFLKLALGNEKKHDEMDGLVIEGVKVHSAA